MLAILHLSLQKLQSRYMLAVASVSFTNAQPYTVWPVLAPASISYALDDSCSIPTLVLLPLLEVCHLFNAKTGNKFTFCKLHKV